MDVGEAKEINRLTVVTKYDGWHSNLGQTSHFSDLVL